MIEFLMTKWVEVVFSLLVLACLLLIIFVIMCYEDSKREDEYEDLKKMMPELPKEKRKK